MKKLAIVMLIVLAVGCYPALARDNSWPILKTFSELNYDSSLSDASLSLDQNIALKMSAFERSYIFFRDEGIFHRDPLTSLNCAMWSVCYYDRHIPIPVLGTDEQENIKLTKDYLQKVFYSRLNKLDEIHRKLIGGLTATDPYGRLIPGDEFQTKISKGMGSYEGDGVELEYMDGKVIVFLVFLNTPAATTGIQTCDEVLKVNNVSLENLASEKEFDERVKQFAPDEFKEGKEINYFISRNGEKKTFQTKAIKITDKNKLVTWKLKGDIGIIEVSEFGVGCSIQFFEALNKIKAASAKGLIVSLRNNPGGYVWEAMLMIKAITGSGFKHRLSNGREKICIADDQLVKGPQFEGPIAVLINGDSASAAETTAASLQEYGATVFGKTSYGKNFGQRIVLLPDRNYLLASDHWIRTMDGHSWLDGIQPDVYAEDTEVWDKAESFLREKIKMRPYSDNQPKVNFNLPEFSRWNKIYKL